MRHNLRSYKWQLNNHNCSGTRAGASFLGNLNPLQTGESPENETSYKEPTSDELTSQSLQMVIEELKRHIRRLTRESGWSDAGQGLEAKRAHLMLQGAR